jgi:hypothetical protein
MVPQITCVGMASSVTKALYDQWHTQNSKMCKPKENPRGASVEDRKDYIRSIFTTVESWIMDEEPYSDTAKVILQQLSMLAVIYVAVVGQTTLRGIGIALRERGVAHDRIPDLLDQPLLIEVIKKVTKRQSIPHKELSRILTECIPHSMAYQS